MEHEDTTWSLNYPTTTLPSRAIYSRFAGDEKFSIVFLIFVVKMQFNIQPLKHTDYEEFLVIGGKIGDGHLLKRIFLPENGTGGYMIYVDDTPVVAGFLYNTNSDVAWVDFIISNFNYKDRENRLIAIDMLLKSLEERAVAINKKIFICTYKAQKFDCIL